ncbi:MAG TPA: hypothetical protein VH157_10595 [Bryobacteraceae bacterium]|nr:hypothetical protein [Bryobacteraceae bacterium]
MSVKVLQNIREAIGNLNPEEIRSHTERPLRLFLYAHSEQAYRQMEDFFAPPELSAARRAELQRVIYRASESVYPSQNHDLEIYFEDSPICELSRTNQVFAFRADAPQQTVHDILARRPDLAVPLALHVHPFREEVSRRMVKKVAKENAIFALATAIPDIIPFVSLPWAIGEFASDTAFLTANQIRMAFLLAAASDRDVGYREQKGEIASIVLGAFGWRALARELVGKIPMGGGLIPKAAIAYAGTRVVGLSLERFYRVGQAYTREERRQAYIDALDRGKTYAASVLDGLKLPGR